MWVDRDICGKLVERNIVLVGVVFYTSRYLTQRTFWIQDLCNFNEKWYEDTFSVSLSVYIVHTLCTTYLLHACTVPILNGLHFSFHPLYSKQYWLSCMNSCGVQTKIMSPELLWHFCHCYWQNCLRFYKYERNKNNKYSYFTGRGRSLRARKMWSVVFQVDRYKIISW